MPIEFRCPSCRTDLRAPDSKRGTDGACPRCGADVCVPVREAFVSKLERGYRWTKGSATLVAPGAVALVLLGAGAFAVAMPLAFAPHDIWTAYATKGDVARTACGIATLVVFGAASCVVGLGLLDRKRWAPVSAAVLLGLAGLAGLREVVRMVHDLCTPGGVPLLGVVVQLVCAAWLLALLVRGVTKLLGPDVRRFCRY